MQENLSNWATISFWRGRALQNQYYVKTHMIQSHNHNSALEVLTQQLLPICVESLSFLCNEAWDGMKRRQEWVKVSRTVVCLAGRKGLMVTSCCTKTSRLLCGYQRLGVTLTAVITVILYSLNANKRTKISMCPKQGGHKICGFHRPVSTWIDLKCNEEGLLHLTHNKLIKRECLLQKSLKTDTEPTALQDCVRSMSALSHVKLPIWSSCTVGLPPKKWTGQAMGVIKAIWLRVTSFYAFLCKEFIPPATMFLGQCYDFLQIRFKMLV